MLKTINPTWRTTCWLQLVVQGISDDEVPWYELVIPLMVGTEGTALSLAKHLVAVWRWSIKVLGQDICLPTPTALNIGQFMTKEEMSEGVDEPLWFVAYSHILQQVGLVAHRWKWEWMVGKTPEDAPRGIFCKREEGPVAYAITFVDELAIRVPSLDA